MCTGSEQAPIRTSDLTLGSTRCQNPVRAFKQHPRYWIKDAVQLSHTELKFESGGGEVVVDFIQDALFISQILRGEGCAESHGWASGGVLWGGEEMELP